MRCAVIGGTGYVGVRLVDRLLDAGHEVAALVRRPHKLAATGWAERVDVVPGDLADPTAPAAGWRRWPRSRGTSPPPHRVAVPRARVLRGGCAHRHRASPGRA